MASEIISGMGGKEGDQAPDARNRTLHSAAEGIGSRIACYFVRAEQFEQKLLPARASRVKDRKGG